jgi:hypothetical protein
LIEIFEEERDDIESKNKELESNFLMIQKENESLKMKVSEKDKNTKLNNQNENKNIILNLEKRLSEALQKIEEVSTQNKNLEMTNELLINKMQGSENHNLQMKQTCEELQRKLYFLTELKNQKENKNTTNMNNKRSEGYNNNKVNLKNWTVQIVPEVSFFKLKNKINKIENNLSILFDQEKDEINNDMYIPRFEHEEKLKLEIMQLKKEHLKDKTKTNLDYNEKIKNINLELQNESNKVHRLQQSIREKEEETLKLTKV